MEEEYESNKALYRVNGDEDPKDPLYARFDFQGVVIYIAGRGAYAVVVFLRVEGWGRWTCVMGGEMVCKA